MAEEARIEVAERGPRKRKLGRKKGSSGKKKMRAPPGGGERVKVNKKMKKLFRKRAREYSSDDDDDREQQSVAPEDEEVEGDWDEDVDSENGEGFSDAEESGEIQPGIANFTEGSRAFKMAFKSIIKNSVADDALGPVLSAHKKLVAEKLAEEGAEWKSKGEAKKEKRIVGEKGHVKPANYLDLKEKFLISVATKGVVKLFNAVNKAQHAQKGLNPSSFKDAKLIKKRKKEAFFTELGKTSVSAADPASKASGSVDGEGPAWAPLRDNYMLTSSKLKDWDKMPDSAVAEDVGRMSQDDSSDGD